MTGEPFCRVAQGFAACGVTPLASNAVAVDSASGLELIGRDDLNLVIWNRADAPNLAEMAASLPDARDVDPTAERARLNAASLVRDCDAYVSALFEGRDETLKAVKDDLALLTRIMFRATRTSAVHVRLERLLHDGCKFFHSDIVGIRLLCSYAGEGTQWLPDYAVNRLALGSKSNDRICSDRAAIGSLQRGAVGLFKGDRWPGNAGRGVVHRSPPVQSDHEARVLLCLDPA